LAACPGDRIPRSRIRIRSRILGSNHFAFQSLAAVASGQVSGSVRFLGASPLGAPTTSASTARHLPQHLTGRSSSSRTTTSIVATAAPLAASLRTSVTPRAFDNRRQSFHLRTTAARTRFLNARRWRSSHQDIGINFQSFLLVLVGQHIAIDFYLVIGKGFLLPFSRPGQILCRFGLALQRTSHGRGSLFRHTGCTTQ
jgi:hypothetical protein